MNFDDCLGRGSSFVNRKTKETMRHTNIVITVSYAYTHAHTVPVVVVQVYQYKSLMIQVLGMNIDLPSIRSDFLKLSLEVLFK